MVKVHWSYEGLSYRHTETESPDPADHRWQGPMGADELIVHAANLHLFRTDTDTRNPRVLWSLRNGVPPEDRKVPSLPENR